jgi:hypothetical protein
MVDCCNCKLLRLRTSQAQCMRVAKLSFVVVLNQSRTSKLMLGRGRVYPESGIALALYFIVKIRCALQLLG